MALWLADKPLVLASKSAPRRALLEAAGIPIEVCPADIDERAVERAAVANAAGDVAALLAREKARAISVGMPGRLVLGADQTLVLGDRRFDKPADIAAARAQLRALSGKTHELHSGIAFVRDGQVLNETVQVARMTMRAFSDRFLEAYLEAAGPAVSASVGAYQLERYGVHLFERVEADHFTILGLPLLAALEFLRQEGSLAL
jgi:nucleoside triphosphate pyrophosphatase